VGSHSEPEQVRDSTLRRHRATLPSDGEAQQCLNLRSFQQ